MRNKPLFLLLLGLSVLFALTQCHKEDNNPENQEDVEVVLTDNAIEKINENFQSQLDQLGDKTVPEVMATLAEWIKNEEGVVSTKAYDDLVEIVYADGTMDYVMMIEEDDDKGDFDFHRNFEMPAHKLQTRGVVGNQKGFIYDAFPHTFPTISPGDTTQMLFERYGYECVHPREKECTIDTLKTIFQYGFVQFKTHGEKDMLATGERVTKDRRKLYRKSIKNGLICQGRMVVKPVGHSNYSLEGHFFCVTTKFFQNLEGRFDSTIVFNGACKGFIDNSTLKNAFLDHGAATYIGFTNTVKANFSGSASSFVVEALFYGMNIGEAYDEIASIMHCRDYGDYTTCIELEGSREVRWFELPEDPTVTTNEVQSSDIDYTTATVTGSVDYPDQSQLEGYERGFVYGLSPYSLVLSDYSDYMAYTGTDYLNFSCTLRDLSSNTKYYVRAYSRWKNDEVVYGNTVSFNTKEELTPTVQTLPVVDITVNSALLKASLDGQTSYAVTERGFCYGTVSNQGIGNAGSNKITVGSGMGAYSYSLEGLISGTTYYVKAYAITEQGVTYYGEERSFTTINDDPQVVTMEVENITDISAVLRAGLVGNTTQTIVERGFCYGTVTNQGIGNLGSTKVVSSGADYGFFFYNLDNLTPRTTYYVKAYAITNLGRTLYGEERSFRTCGVVGPEGTVRGLFSVSANKQVWFSKGNLQYQASTNTWRFAEHQYDFVGGTDWYWHMFYGNVEGSNNSDVSETYSGWIDLFPWGTSGYNHGAVCYQPWSIDGSVYDYYAYGSAQASLGDQTGKADWGYNPISNGGNVEGVWKTLTASEWYYLLKTRTTPSGLRFTGAIVNEVKGLIILPDEWSASDYPLNRVNNTNTIFNKNQISLEDWENRLEPAGAVFLPCGIVWSHFSSNTSDDGNYWASNPWPNGTGTCYSLLFHNDCEISTNYNVSRPNRISVRLVQDHN